MITCSGLRVHDFLWLSPGPLSGNDPCGPAPCCVSRLSPCLNVYGMTITCMIHCQARLLLAESVPVKLRTGISLIITLTPNPPIRTSIFEPLTDYLETYQHYQHTRRLQELLLWLWTFSVFWSPKYSTFPPPGPSLRALHLHVPQPPGPPAL